MTNLAETDTTTPAPARPPHARVRRYGERRPFMRLACSPFARAAPPARSRPHTDRHTTPAPEMTIGASTRVEPRGSLPRGVPKPRPPNPFHGRSARAPSLPPSPCCRCRAPQVGSHYRARPNSAGRGHSAARDHRQPPPPVAPRPCPQDRKTAREREIRSEGEGRALLHAAAAPGFTAPRAAGSASGAQETPRRAPCRWRSHQSPLCALLRCCPVGSRAGAGEAAARCERPTIRRRCLFPAVVAEV